MEYPTHVRRIEFYHFASVLRHQLGDSLSFPRRSRKLLRPNLLQSIPRELFQERTVLVTENVAFISFLLQRNHHQTFHVPSVNELLRVHVLRTREERKVRTQEITLRI